MYNIIVAVSSVRILKLKDYVYLSGKLNNTMINVKNNARDIFYVLLACSGV